MKALAVGLLALGVSAPAFAGPYVSSKVAAKGENSDYEKTEVEVRLGYETKTGNLKPYIEIGPNWEMKDDEDDAGKGTGLGGGLGGVGGAGSALSDLEAQIDKLKSDREKGRQSEKWFALAEVGLGMLASQNPTVLGALGEGGLRGLKSFREGKKSYDKDMLSYLTTKASIQKTRGDQALKSAYYAQLLKNAENKLKTGSMTTEDALKIRSQLLKQRDDLLDTISDPAEIKEIKDSYNDYIKRIETRFLPGLYSPDKITTPKTG